MALTIRQRLTLGTLFLFGLLPLCAGLGIFQLNRLKQDAQAILEDNYETVRYVQGMQLALHDGDRTAFEKHLVLQEANITEAGEGERTAALKRDFERWNVDGTPAVALFEDLQAILDLNLEAIDRKNKAALTTAQDAQQWLWGIAALTLVVGFVFSLTFPRLVTEPIKSLHHAVAQIATGNYRHRVPTIRSDELGALSHAFNDMSAELERWQNSNLALIMAEKNRVEAVLNSLQDAAFGVNDGGVVLFANRKAIELLGISEDELVGKAIPQLIRDNDLLRHVLAEGEGRPFKAVLDGTEQYFSSSHSRIRSTQEEIGTVYLLHNITAYQERDQAKTHFLATISHELKTPLASSDIGLDLLERSAGGLLTEEQRAILGDLRKDHQRLVRIVGELLDMAQLESGRMRVELKRHPLIAIVHDAIEAMQASAEAKRVRLDDHSIPSDISILADADKAAWALINLLSNALRVSPQAGTVKLSAIVDNEYVLLSIADQGQGLTPDQCEHLFERFAPHVGNGTGLGLSIARDMLRAMRGDIELGSTGQQGTVFTMRFLLDRS